MLLVTGQDDEEINRHWMSCVVPRPIGWISTLSKDGVPNLAPYSFFNALSEKPPMVMFGSNGRHAHGAKDTAGNILETGEFVVNMATYDLLKYGPPVKRPGLRSMNLNGRDSNVRRQRW